MLSFVRRAQYWILPVALALNVCGLITVRSHAQQKTPATPAPEQRQRPRTTSTPVAQPARQSDQKADSAAISDEDVLRVETDLTNVLFTAVDKDRRFVTNLKKGDVRVLENGAPQDVSIFERETDLPLSLALLIDTSKSEFKTLPDEKSAARAFIDSIIRPQQDRAAVISFTGEAKIEQSLTSDKNSLRAAIERVQIVLPPEPKDDEPDLDPQDPRGYTSVWDAIAAASTEVMSQTPERTRRALILLTDGDDTHSMNSMQDAIDIAIKNNTVVYAIGIGDRKDYDVKEGTLRKMAERTGGRAFFPRDEAALSVAFDQIELELRSQYLIAYSSSNKASDGSYRQINLEIVNPELRTQKLRLLYRQGYYARHGRVPTRTGPKS
jgi:VWFA-related protein